MTAVRPALFFAVALWPLLCRTASVVLTEEPFSGDSELLPLDEVLVEAEPRNSSDSTEHRARRKRFVSNRDMTALLDYHNRVRSQVFPTAANMEYMVWDEGLAKSADSWASQCLWEHGPSSVLRHVGQNLSVYTGRYKSIIDLIKAWYDERRSFSFPNNCKGNVCGHYTQMVWASSNKIGCAIRQCRNMNVFGSTWKEATYLVCNYSIKGNWVGEAPYKVGRPCSACPSSYGGSCSKNLCDSTSKSIRKTRPFRG